MDLRQVVKRYGNVFESFTRKIRSKKNDELTAKADTAFVPDGVYILHETLGVKTVDSWNTEFNEGVVGILLIEDDHKIVISLEDSPEDLPWSKKRELINEPIEKLEEAESDFNGEYYCRKLNSPDFPAAYYCKTYNKGNRSWYLPSTGELWMIYSHFDEIQNALSIVGGQKLITTWDEGAPVYWSSTEYSARNAWRLLLSNSHLGDWGNKVSYSLKVRPVSKFGPSVLRESFTRKISSRKNTELISKTVETFIPDGVYILHQTLGVRTVDGWNPKDNEGVVGILLIEDDHKIVIALEDSPKNLHWSKNCVSINKPLKKKEDFNSDFNGECYCRKLDSPDYPAAYYCLNYKKGGRNWYLPSSGELLMIYNHLEEIQNTLETVGGQKFVTAWRVGMYWSSTEFSYFYACYLNFCEGFCGYYGTKQESIFRVRPVSKFEPSVLRESFTRKISRKKNNELISKTGVETFIPDGVYILHESLGVRTVDGWNPKDNEGVVGILFIEDNHKIVISLEDSPEDLLWSTKRELINEPVRYKDAESDFNGEYYCRNLNSPDFPAAYYCLNYQKGNRSWYLPSSGELWMIYNHLEEIQNALETVGGQKFVISKGNYWSSTELSDFRTWYLDIDFEDLNGNSKHIFRFKVRPVSKFGPSILKESFTKKISKKNGTEVIGRSERIFLEESIAQIVFSFGKNAMVPNNDKKPKFGYKLPFGCLSNFLEGSGNKVLDNGDVIKRTETRSLMGYTQTYEIIAVHIYFDSLSKKVYVGMKKPSSWSQYESFPKIYNLYGASSSGILELSDFSVDELRRILRNLQERTKFKKPLRKKIILKGEESF